MSDHRLDRFFSNTYVFERLLQILELGDVAALPRCGGSYQLSFQSITSYFLKSQPRCFAALVEVRDSPDTHFMTEVCSQIIIFHTIFFGIDSAFFGLRVQFQNHHFNRKHRFLLLVTSMRDFSTIFREEMENLHVRPTQSL
jgi:hypothetical protein